MKIVIAGGSGQIGTLLARALSQNGHEVTVFSRRPTNTLNWRTVYWDTSTKGAWESELEGADVLINLAGRSVNCRYTEIHRHEILESRIKSVRALGAALQRRSQPPPLWLQASTATIYAHRFDAANDEATGIIGGDEPNAPETWKFSIHVATTWEKEFNEIRLPNTRKVLLRSAITMSPDPGGAFATLLGLVRAGLGGQSGNGQQYVSWIHEFDFIRALEWLVAQKSVEGAVNIASPHPLPNIDFMRELRQAWGKRIALPASEWMLELGAWFLRTETELVLKSRRVVPGILSKNGFEFAFPDWPGAARELCARWRTQSNAS